MTLAARIAAGFQSVAADIKQLYSSVMTPAEKALLSNLAGAVDSAEVAAIAAEQSATAAVATHEAAPNPHPQYAVGNTTTLSYTYTGVLSAPPVAMSGTTELVLGSPTGKERVNGLLLTPVNVFLTSIEFSALEFIGGSNFNLSNMPALTSLSLPALTAIENSFGLYNLNALTSLNLPALTSVGGIVNPYNLNALTSMNLPALKFVGGSFSPSNMPVLTSLSAPALTTVGSAFSPTNMPALTSLSVPALTTVGSAFSPNSLTMLTSLNLSALTSVGNSFSLSNMPALTSLNLPALKFVVGSFGATSLHVLTSLSVPALMSVGGISFTSGTAQLTTFELPTTLKEVNGNVNITSAALNQTSVDSILVCLAALDGTNGTTAYSNRNITITGTSSAPSLFGIVAKTTLVARGCTVTHN